MSQSQFRLRLERRICRQGCLPGYRCPDHPDDGGQDAAAGAAGNDLADDACDVESAGPGGCQTQKRAQNLAAHATTDGTGNRVAKGAEIDVPGETAGEVSTCGSAQELNDKGDD